MQEGIRNIYKGVFCNYGWGNITTNAPARSMKDRVKSIEVGDIVVIMIYGPYDYRSMLNSPTPEEYPEHIVFCNKYTGNVKYKRGQEFNKYCAISDDDMDILDKNLGDNICDK